MSDENNELFENFARNVASITARKIDYFNVLIEELEKSRGSALEGEVRTQIIDAVTTLDPDMFISPEEKKCRRLSAHTKFEDLDRKAISDHIANLIRLD